MVENNYFSNLNINIKKYFKILSNDIPDFIYKYIDTPEMQRLAHIGVGCGTDYTSIFNNKFFYSRLDHSIAVALIIWNFTKDKKQTIAGLFHDISMPAFSHIVDFLHGDYLKQEVTESMTSEIIRNSKDILKCLEEDGIKVEEVENYHIYPIADNKMPQLSADRLEYSFSNGFIWDDIWKIEEVEPIYKDVIISKNENNIEELSFKSLDKAIVFIKRAYKQWLILSGKNEDKVVIQFYTDILRTMIDQGFLKEPDLYSLSEKEIIDIILNDSNENIATAFENFQNTSEVFRSEEKITDKYCVSIDVKKRYVNPLVCVEGDTKRISEVSEVANNKINDLLNFKDTKYAYIDLKTNF